MTIEQASNLIQDYTDKLKALDNKLTKWIKENQPSFRIEMLGDTIMKVAHECRNLADTHGIMVDPIVYQYSNSIA